MRWRVDWFAVLYILGALFIAHVADTLHDGGWMLLVEAQWVLGMPAAYALGLFRTRRREVNETPEEMTDARQG